MAVSSFPIFGTGGNWKAASGSGTPSDPFVPAVNVAGIGPATITNKSSTYTFVLADAGQSFTNTGASNTFTIDSNANVNYVNSPSSAITITNKAATALTIAVTGSATINGANANRTIPGATTGVYPTVSIWPEAADDWIMVGNFT